MTKYIVKTKNRPPSIREFYSIKEAKDWGKAHTEPGSQFEISYQNDSTTGVIWRQRVF
jgi:hypothetical protein